MNETNATSSGARDNLESYYVAVVPCMMLGCFLAVCGNLYILLCLRWIRRRAFTVNLVLSISLAGADAYAALLVLLGLIVNSYLPKVHGLDLGASSVCYFLAFELVRLAGLITSILHLFALALNHWLSIANPLKYKTMVNVGCCRAVVTVLWTLPLLIMLICALSVPGQGFRSMYDCRTEFYYQFPFRIVVFVQFALPLVVMLGIYCYILRRLAMVRNALTENPDSHRSSNGSTSVQPLTPTTPVLTKQTRRSAGEPPVNKRSSLRVNARVNSVKSKIRGVTTTLLILGTFVLGWLPAVLLFALVCNDCLVSAKRTTRTLFVLSVMVNCLIIIKLLINPLVYAWRVLEIRYALWLMHATRFGWRTTPLLQAETPNRFRRLDSRVQASQRTSSFSVKIRR